MPNSRKPNGIVVLISLLLGVIVSATFILWWKEIIAETEGFSGPFTYFCWSLVITVVWLTLVRAAREWWP